MNIENFGQVICKNIAPDDASSLKRIVTDGVRTVECQGVERITCSKEVKVDRT